MSFTKHLLVRILLQYFLLCQRVRAAEFRPNCTFPQSGVTFVASPPTRSTFDILWSCLFTIFACTWTVLHLNVPSVQKTTEGWRKVLKSIWRKLKWMIVSIFLPEWLVAKALGDYVAAGHSLSCPEMEKHIGKDGPWTKTHAFYANMGGFILDPFEAYQEENTLSSAPSDSVRVNSDPAHREESTEPNTPSDSIQADLYPPWRDHLDWENFETIEDFDIPVDLPCAVNAAQICVFLDTGLISKLPPITEAEIEDKSKVDLFTKLVALGQVLWLVIQLIVRAVRRLPCTQLEIATLSFAVCTFGTYVLWIKKPKDIGVATRVNASRSLTDEEKGILLSMQHRTFLERLLLGDRNHESPKETIRYDVYNEEARLWVLPRIKKARKLERFHFETEDLGFSLSAAVFGACHLLAWNFEFPSCIERTLWRSASLVITTALPVQQLMDLLIWSLYYSTTDETGKFGKSLYNTLKLSINWMIIGLYLGARTFIIVEVFRDLAYLPPGAFVGTWTTSIPHIS